MAKSRYIVSIDQTSGLPPAVVNMINGNFWNLLDMLEDPEVVIVAGVNAPDPRTDETIWYKTDTGALSIWSRTHVADPDVPGDEDVWGWLTLATIVNDIIDESGITDYNRLLNKPSIEHVTLVGNKDMPDLGIFIDNEVDIDDHPQSDMYALDANEINTLWNGGA